MLITICFALAVSPLICEGRTADDPVAAPEGNAVHVPSAEESAEHIGKHGHLMASMLEKMNCLEKRMDDFLEQERSLESRIEDLKDTVKDEIRDKLHSVDTRVGDRLDRLENRLEDKLLLRASSPDSNTCINNADVCTGVSSQMSAMAESIGKMEENLTNFTDDQIYRAEAAANLSASTLSALDNKLNSLASGISGVSSLTGNLVSAVDSFRSSYSSGALVPVDEFFDALGTGRKEWRLAFRGTAYNNVAINPAYLHGTGIPSEVEAGCKQFDRNLPCANHYRNTDAMENWANIDQVLFAIYVKGRMVQNVVFNGRGSDFINWFAANRVVISSWADLKTKSHNYFSIFGHVISTHIRKFYINHLYNSCAGDLGWFVASDLPNGLCSWEKSAAIPYFRYAPGNSVSKMSSHAFGRADAIGVFLKYQ